MKNITSLPVSWCGKWRCRHFSDAQEAGSLDRLYLESWALYCYSNRIAWHQEEAIEAGVKDADELAVPMSTARV